MREFPHRGRRRMFRSAYRATSGRSRLPRRADGADAGAESGSCAVGRPAGVTSLTLTISTSNWTATAGGRRTGLAKVGFLLKLPDEGRVERIVERSRIRDGQFDAEARRHSREGPEVDA